MNSISIICISIALIRIIATIRQLNQKIDALVFQILELQKMMMANFGNGSTKVMDTVTTSLGDNEKEPEASS